MGKRRWFALLIAPLVLAGCPNLRDGEVPLAPPLAFGFPGPFEEARFLTKIDDAFNATVFYPVSDEPISDAPLIVFNVGWNAIRNTYESYCIQLAQWGYVCIIRYYPSLGIIGLGNDLFDVHVEHCLRVIDWAGEQNLDPESPIFGMVDTSNVGIIGHSLGGSVSLVAAPYAPQVRAVVSLDALYDNPHTERAYFFEALEAPVMYIGASVTSLCSRPPTATYDLVAATLPPKMLVTIQGADHMAFMEDAPDSPDSREAGNIFCATGSMEPREVRMIAHRYLIPFFNVYLQGQTDFATWFRGDDAMRDITAGLVTIDDELGELP